MRERTTVSSRPSKRPKNLTRPAQPNAQKSIERWREIAARNGDTLHELKSISPFFEDVRSGRKTFEIRRNDRDFHEHDYLMLRHWNEDTLDYTGDIILRRVVYMTDYEQRPGFVVMGIA